MDGDIRIEIKSEDTPSRTRNVAVEFWNTELNQASGILGTSANLWLHLIREGEAYKAIEFEVDELRRLVIEAGVVKHCGHNALCKIIPVEIFLKHARRVLRLVEGAENASLITLSEGPVSASQVGGVHAN
jgi:hypothetical protein